MGFRVGPEAPEAKKHETPEAKKVLELKFSFGNKRKQRLGRETG
jgi:hypothetical protein